MQRELSNIISAMIGNIGEAREKFYDNNLRDMSILALKIARGISVLEKRWPNLSEEEKLEIEAVIKAINAAYSEEELDDNVESIL